MLEKLNDPVGNAIKDFANNGIDRDITVCSDICDDDVIPVSYLFRDYNEMPEIEKLALIRCTGKTLDVGAAAGTHATYLKEKGIDVECIDISPLAVDHLKEEGLKARTLNFFDLKNEKFDTLLMLMNGIGIAGTLSNLENTLAHAKSLLNPNGKILFDSSNIKYLYEDEEGGYWMDLNNDYYGNFRFQMKYKEHESVWFDWLYVDFENMQKVAELVGFKATLLYDADDQYLAELSL